MNIDLEKKNLDDCTEYANAQVNSAPKDLRNDFADQGLTEDEVNDVTTYYRPSNKQKMFSHPFSFHGRIRRLEYGLSIVILYAYAFLIYICDSLDSEATLLTPVLHIPLYWFWFAQGAKRCHDRGNSGWFQLIPFYRLWMLFGDGDDYENDYGPDPKE